MAWNGITTVKGISDPFVVFSSLERMNIQNRVWMVGTDGELDRSFNLFSVN